MEASASSVFTGNQGGQGDGTGRAAILDKHPDFLPYAMNIANKVRQDKKLALERQRKADQDFKKAVAEVKPETTWQYAQGEIAQKANELREYMIKEKMAGRDPLDPYSEAGKEVARRRDELASLAYLAKDAEDKFNKAVAARVKDFNAYDAEHFNKFIQGLKGKTIAEQAEYINSSNPLRPVIIDTEVVGKTIPAYYSQMLERGAKTTAIEEIREEDYRPILESYLSTPEGEEHFNQGVEDGKWKNEDEYFAEMTKLAQSLKPPQIKETYDEARVSGSSSSGGGGGGTVKVNIASQLRNDAGLTTGVNKNVARVSRSGTQDDLPAVEVDVVGGMDSKGVKQTASSLEQFIPVEFVLGKDGKIGVRGKRIVPFVSTGNAYADAMADKKPTYEEFWVDYDTNKALFDAQLGVDMYDYFNQQNAGKTAAKTENKKVKTFKGVPEGGF